MESTEEIVEMKAQKPQLAIRCAKASILLSSLKYLLNSTNHHQFQKDEDNEEVELLKVELLKEKMKNKKMKVCSVMEISVQILLLLSFWTLCLLLVFNFLVEV